MGETFFIFQNNVSFLSVSAQRQFSQCCGPVGSTKFKHIKFFIPNMFDLYKQLYFSNTLNTRSQSASHCCTSALHAGEAASHQLYCTELQQVYRGVTAPIRPRSPYSSVHRSMALASEDSCKGTSFSFPVSSLHQKCFSNEQYIYHNIRKLMYPACQPSMNHYMIVVRTFLL